MTLDSAQSFPAARILPTGRSLSGLIRRAGRSGLSFHIAAAEYVEHSRGDRRHFLDSRSRRSSLFSQRHAVQKSRIEFARMKIRITQYLPEKREVRFDAPDKIFAHSPRQSPDGFLSAAPIADQL